MAQNKNFSVIINEFFFESSKAITEVYKNGKMSNSNITHLKNIYSMLLDKNFKSSDEFIKAMTLEYPDSKNNFLTNLLKQIYLFISAPEMDAKVTKYSAYSILGLIDQIPRTSRLYNFRSELSNAVKKLYKLKKMHASSLQKSLSIPSINSKVIDFGEAKNRVKQLNEFMALQINFKNTLNDNQNKAISKFLTDLFSALSAYIDAQKIETNNMEENKKYRNSINSLITQIDILKSQISNSEFSSEIKSINRICKLLKYSLMSNIEKAKFNEENRLRKAYSPKSFKKFLDLNSKAIEHANNVLQEYGQNPIDFKIIAPFQEMADTLDPHLYDEKFFSTNLKKLVSAVKKEIENKQKVIKNPMLTYKTCYNLALDNNRDAWKKIVSNVTIQDKNTGSAIKAQISSTPAADFGAFTHLAPGTGLTSNHRDSQRAINMWKTELSSGGNVLFSAIRHGNTRGREDASVDIILAAAIQQYGLSALQNSPSGKTWEVKFSNVQLMSPMSILPKKTDGQMPLDQLKMFNNLAGKTVSAEIKAPTQDNPANTKKISLKLLKPVLFNFGVNELHFMFGGALVKSTYNENKQALSELFGSKTVENIEKKFKAAFPLNKFMPVFKNRLQKNVSIENEYLAGQVGNCIASLQNGIKNCLSDQDVKNTNLKIKKIKNLSYQILDIFFRTNGRGIPKNPSALPTRVSLLMFLIGYPITFNCKSGKDRTGAVAADINNLALYLEANNGVPPDPYKGLSDKDLEESTKVFNETKSDKIAQANLGVRGLKIDSKGFTQRQGKMKGASKHGKS